MDIISSKSYLQRIEALLQITATLVSLTRGGIKLAPPVHKFILLQTEQENKRTERNIKSMEGQYATYVCDTTSLIH